MHSRRSGLPPSPSPGYPGAMTRMTQITHQVVTDDVSLLQEQPHAVGLIVQPVKLLALQAWGARQGRRAVSVYSLRRKASHTFRRYRMCHSTCILLSSSKRPLAALAKGQGAVSTSEQR